MVTRLVWLGTALVAVGIVGCGDDDGGSDGGGGTGNTGNSGGSGGAGNSGNSGGAGNSGNSGGTGNTGNTGGSAGGSGGSGGAGSNNPDAATFCAEFDSTCGYGNGYADETACTTAYDGYDETRKTCVNDHVDLAAGDTATHCPHAAGEGPCS